jgi:hypothetical protein
LIFMAESLETIVGTGTLLVSGALGGSTGYIIENTSGYKVMAIGLVGYIAATALLFVGTHLVCKNPETK